MRIATLLVLSTYLFLGCKTTQQTTQKSPPVSASSDRTVLSAVDIQVRQGYVDATTQMIRGDYRKAKELFQGVLELDPNNHAAQFNLAKLALAEREYDQAISYSLLALQREQENYWYYQVLQQAYEEKGEYEKAISQLETITQRFPTRIEEKSHLAELYFKNDQTEAAIRELDAIEQQVGFHYETALRKLNLFQQIGDTERALQVSEKLIEQDPGNTRFYQIQYELLQATQQSSRAAETLEKLLEQDPENGLALLYLAKYYQGLGQTAQAEAYQLRAFRNPEIEVGTKVHLIREMWKNSQNKPEMALQAEKFSNLLYQTHPSAPEAQTIRAQLLGRNGQIDSARFFYRAALQQEPSDLQTWQELLQLDYDIQAIDWLYPDAEEALELFPNQEEILFYYGLSANRMGNPEGARYALNKILKRNQSAPLVLAQTQAELALLDLQEGNAQAANSLLAEAKTLLEVALKTQQNDPALLEALGYVSYLQEDFADALQWYEKAQNALSGSNVLLLERMGDALFKTGQRAAAEEKWQKARELGARSLDIQKKLKEL